MRDRFVGLLEKADLALAACAGIIDPVELDPLIAVIGDVRTRLAYPEDVLVVALAGGTGSGKSSLFNALAGEELVDTGGVRPTTSQPAAAVPATVGGALDTYLDRMGVDERHVYDGLNICLLDLPDTDSVETDHRYRADSLLPRVDLVIWVTDPEKYRDARIHRDYLRPMASHPEQVIVVINQVDRLSSDQTRTVLADLGEALDEDGIQMPLVIPTAAAPYSGPPIGVDLLARALEGRAAARDNLYRKLGEDLASTSRVLERGLGVGLDYDSRAADVVDAAAASLVAGDLGEASDTMTAFLDGLSAESGGVLAQKIGAVTAQVPAHLRRIGDGLRTASPPRRRWLRWRRTEVPESGVETVRGQLSEAVIRPVRALLAQRATAIASIADLALDVESLQQQFRR